MYYNVSYVLGAGKTSILYEVIVDMILPTQFGPWSLNGKRGSVVFYDCDLRFNLLRLVGILESRICLLTGTPLPELCDTVIPSYTNDGDITANKCSSHNGLTRTELTEVLLDCLSRLFVSTPLDSLQLISAVQVFNIYN